MAKNIQPIVINIVKARSMLEISVSMIRTFCCGLEVGGWMRAVGCGLRDVGYV